MFPIVAGLLMGAAMGGGIAALQKKNILEGALMGGIGGALGGAFMPGVAGAAGVAGEGATSLAATEAAGSALSSASNPGVLGTEFGVQGAMAGGAPLPGATASTSLFGGSGGIGNFLSQNKYALMGGGLGGMMASGQEPDKPDQGNIREYTYNREINPLFGQPGQSYYTNAGFTAGDVIPVEDYNKANGGIIALAEGGETGLEIQRYSTPIRKMEPEVAAYNNQLMKLANQQYNVNLRPGPNQVPGSAGYIAPVAKPAALPFVPAEGSVYAELLAKKKKKEEMEAKGGYKPYESWANVDGGGDASGNDAGSSAGGESGTGEGWANGGFMSSYAGGGISSLGTYSDGGQLLKGPGDGVSDDIPAQIGARQPARLADGEFVVPARVVSELGNGSTDAGAKRLYAMMDRVQNNRRKSIGKGKVAVNSRAYKHLPA